MALLQLSSTGVVAMASRRNPAPSVGRGRWVVGRVELPRSTEAGD